MHWIAMIIELTLFMWATFMIYFGSFTYLVDWYVGNEHYSGTID